MSPRLAPAPSPSIPPDLGGFCDYEDPLPRFESTPPPAPSSVEEPERCLDVDVSTHAPSFDWRDAWDEYRNEVLNGEGDPDTINETLCHIDNLRDLVDPAAAPSSVEEPERCPECGRLKRLVAAMYAATQMHPLTRDEDRYMNRIVREVRREKGGA